MYNKKEEQEQEKIYLLGELTWNMRQFELSLMEAYRHLKAASDHAMQIKEITKKLNEGFHNG